MRFIKATFPSDKSDAVIKVIEAAKPIDWSLDSGYGRFEKAAEILIAKGSGQSLLDELQDLFGSSPDWRVTVLPVLRPCSALSLLFLLPQPLGIYL